MSQQGVLTGLLATAHFELPRAAPCDFVGRGASSACFWGFAVCGSGAFLCRVGVSAFVGNRQRRSTVGRDPLAEPALPSHETLRSSRPLPGLALEALALLEQVRQAAFQIQASFLGGFEFRRSLQRVAQV